MMMGGTTSGLQTVQAKVGQLREAQEKSTDNPMAEMASIEIPPPIPATEPLVLESEGKSADIELPQIPVEGGSGGGWSKLWSWIPGTGR